MTKKDNATVDNAKSGNPTDMDKEAKQPDPPKEPTTRPGVQPTGPEDHDFAKRGKQ